MPLKIIIEKREIYNEKTNEFNYADGGELVLEHSLKSLSKWESKWHKPFLSNNDENSKTHEEIKDYIKCMTITQNVDERLYDILSEENYLEISSYIQDPMTATTISSVNKTKNNNIITSEVIYAWMVTLGIPFECQNWHINRLLMLIRVINEQNQPAKKINKNDLMKHNASLNAIRRQKLHSKG